MSRSNSANTMLPTVFKKPPFRCAEEGWGEFEMSIVLTVMNKGGEHMLPHDLNFATERYESTQKVVRSCKHRGSANMQEAPGSSREKC